ncbi:hypothetical protein [Mangrovitalea sediminis]|uniref:hypothetical protein n=1 Tax=Mangrovitalea sediminis TaxID=1982043 RepID=UPI000BE4DDD9|nr:hypothetical protein [Mangrovitalea sediminis]
MTSAETGAEAEDSVMAVQIQDKKGAAPMASYCYWGFVVSSALGEEAATMISEARTLEAADLPAWQRQVFALASQLVFAGVSSYADSVQLSPLPPLTPQVEPDEAVQAVGLALSLWVSRALQSRTLQEFKDMADFLGRSLVIHPESAETLLAIPLDAALEHQLHEWVARVGDAEDSTQCRDRVRQAVLSMAQAAVVHYYRSILEKAPDSSHLEQVMRFTAREVEKRLVELMDQLLPTFPQAHLVHMAHYVETQLVRSARPLANDVAARGRGE